MKNSKLVKWYFYKYYNLPKEFEIFKITKNSVHYWIDKEKRQAECRTYGNKFSDTGILRWLKSLTYIGLATDTASIDNGTYMIISGANANNNFSANAELDVYGTGAATTRNGTSKFTLSSGSGTITQITLNLTENGPATGTMGIKCYLCTQSLVPAQVTWNVYSTGNSWTAPGGDVSTLADTKNVTASDVDGTLITWDITSLNYTWGNVAYLILKGDTSTNGAAFYSTAAASNKPYIKITYTVAGNSNFFAFL